MGENELILWGFLNVTPDSFSDGGDFNTLEMALYQAQQMVEAGVDIIDIGGQSTRPGAEIVSLETELNRVIPLIETIRNSSDKLLTNIPISVDTTHSQVAEVAVKTGADIINDISGATFDAKMLSMVAKLNVPIILMHLRGTPKTMQTLTDYQDLIGELEWFLQERIKEAIAQKIKPQNIIIDPGIGFAKNL
jgi:Dihydropteroate synthase (EC 2.5.1.15)